MKTVIEIYNFRKEKYYVNFMHVKSMKAIIRDGIAEGTIIYFIDGDKLTTPELVESIKEKLDEK